MKEIYHGPVQPWTPDADAQLLIDHLAHSGNALGQAYAEAYRNGCFIREFCSVDLDPGQEPDITMVGDLHIVTELAYRHNTRFDLRELHEEDCIALGMHPGLGATRAARVINGMRKVLADRADS